MEGHTITVQDPVKVMALHEAVTIMSKAVATLHPAQTSDEVADATISMARRFEQYLREIG